MNVSITEKEKIWEKAVTILDSEKSNLAAREKIANHFISNEKFKNYWKNAWEQETRELFIDYAITIHNTGLDWWFVDSNTLLRFGRKNQDDNNCTIVGFLNPKNSGLDVLWKGKAIGEHADQERPISQEAIDFWQSDEILTLASELYPSSREGYWPDSYSEPLQGPEPSNNKMNITNLILYGPPGTGKTYSTINEAIKIIDPVFFKNNAKQRSSLKQRFDELISTKQIRFVTFHQSFTYEDFVEGLRAETDDETKQIQYKIENGIFKNICLDAQKSITNNNNLGISENPRIWKISIESANDNNTKKYCFANGEARIGWGHIGDLSNVDLTDPTLDIGTNDKNSLRNFAQEIQPGDILLCIASITDVGAVGIVQSGYIYQETPPQSVRDDYKNVLKVNWVLKNIHFSILPLNNNFRFPVKTVSEMERLNWTELAIALQKAGYSLPTLKSYSEMQNSVNPHVLIIDEINRGNISRIFGELITLIEESKRTGADEALEITLPYSKKPFGVPSNVYLIGTMNTADRSLASLDIALRRRFTFIEMPPKPDLLDDVNVEGVNIGQMLREMNERIEVLLDRDHCLGHAYFIPLKNDKSIEKLKFIFRQQILPLLEEYFFEDWERIAWVLNDQNKKQPEHKFLKNVSADLGNLSNLFGAEVAGNLQDRRWHINEDAFKKIESYRGILGTSE
jgi:5-methylcytosine-specific restriction protein B